MKKCPEKETLEKFVDYELSEEMNKKISQHLSVCDKCLENVRCLLEEDRGLLRSLLTEPSRQKHSARILSETCLSKGALHAYANKVLKEDQLKLVESHLEKCDNCMLELLRVQSLMNAPNDLDLEMSVLNVKKDTVPMRGGGVLEIILKAKDNLLDLIRHTGELMVLTPQLESVRGKEVEKDNSIVIRKDFPERDLSVEVTINREVKESGAAVGISVMSLRSEEFLPGWGVELSGERIHQKGKTNEDGVAEFYGISPDAYDLIINGELTAHIQFE